MKNISKSTKKPYKLVFKGFEDLKTFYINNGELQIYEPKNKRASNSVLGKTD